MAWLLAFISELLSFCLPSKNLKIKLYKDVILLVVLYDVELGVSP